MLQFPNGGCLIESVAELPNFLNATYAFGDFETGSGSPKLDSLNPWHNCKIIGSAGIAITVDQCPNAYYVPSHVLHAGGRDWLNDVLTTATYWANQNIKYDAHVAANELGIFTSGPLVCTLTLAKLIDSDRIMRGGYGLDALSKGWLQKDISQFENRLQPYLGKKNKDYSRIPLDIIAEYACQDVLTNRELLDFIWKHLPEQCNGVANTEIAFTRRLWEMERNGMRFDPQEVKLEQYKTLNRMLQIDDELAKLVGRSFRPHVNEDCYDVLCNQYGLPVLAYTKNQDTGEETTNPSFDKHALVRYAVYPGAHPVSVVPLIQEYRKLNQFNNLFLEGWQAEAIMEGDFAVLHSTYNQAVRTGRLACSRPNAQQLNTLAKRLIHPRKGCSFLSCDASQIEFRLIAHYINDPDIVETYNKFPDTDFHEWVAQGVYGLDEIAFQQLQKETRSGMRGTGKTVNFGIAFGEGKKKLIKQLSVNPYIVREMSRLVDDAVTSGKCPEERKTDLFLSLCTQRATGVYDTYHKTLPTLKPTMKEAENALRRYGHVFNLYGRHRHLPVDAAYRAFNTLNQSSAADMMKERFAELCDRICHSDILTTASVHDEILLDVPNELLEDGRLIRDTIALLESPRAQVRVPIRWSYGTSPNNWAEASKSAKPLLYDKSEATNLEFLQHDLRIMR